MPIKLFLSHSSSDEALASALVGSILSSVQLDDDEIRCTSVAGYKLPVGCDFTATLKEDIGISSVVVGLLTETSISSGWVLFELGAAWGSGKRLLPLVSGEVNASALPGPLASRHVAQLSDASDMAQFLTELAGLLERPLRAYGRVARAIDSLTKAHDQYLIARSDVVKTSTAIAEFQPTSGIGREALRFGVTLGWQMARYEFAFDSPLPEAKAIAPSLATDIGRALKRDGFPDDISTLSYREMIESVLSHYSTTSVGKHAAILLGIASMRATLVGASKNEEHNSEMTQLAFSALAEADPSVLPNKERLFSEIVRQKPTSVAAVLSLVDSLAKRI